MSARRRTGEKLTYYFLRRWATAMTGGKDRNPTYYFIDVDLKTLRLIRWGTERKDRVVVHLPAGNHRVFLTKGQYNKLEKKLIES